MKRNIDRYWLVGLLVVIAVSMGITKIRYRNVSWESVYPIISPTATPTSAPRENQDYPLWEELPYNGINFVVERYSEPGVLVVKTGSINRKVITQEIYEWMIQNRVATESHKLVFEKDK